MDAEEFMEWSMLYELEAEEEEAEEHGRPVRPLVTTDTEEIKRWFSQN